ncbi:hypothetical protein BKA57DRAFT_468961 [Linnemannia elongata]|nr:hypothetical protein BKA57DRAFT_468961 [Linnemannia elongata]
MEVTTTATVLVTRRPSPTRFGPWPQHFNRTAPITTTTTAAMAPPSNPRRPRPRKPVRVPRARSNASTARSHRPHSGVAPWIANIPCAMPVVCTTSSTMVIALFISATSPPSARTTTRPMEEHINRTESTPRPIPSLLLVTRPLMQQHARRRIRRLRLLVLRPPSCLHGASRRRMRSPRRLHLPPLPSFLRAAASRPRTVSRLKVFASRPLLKSRPLRTSLVNLLLLSLQSSLCPSRMSRLVPASRGAAAMATARAQRTHPATARPAPLTAPSKLTSRASL